MEYLEILQSVFGESREDLEAARTLYGIYDRLSTEAERIRAEIAAHEEAGYALISKANAMGVKISELDELIRSRQEMIDEALRSSEAQIGLNEIVAIMSESEREIKERESKLEAAKVRYERNKQVMEELETESARVQREREDAISAVTYEQAEMNHLRTVGPSSMKKRFETVDRMNELMEKKHPLEQDLAKYKEKLTLLYEDKEANAVEIRNVHGALDELLATIREVSREYEDCYKELQEYEQKFPTDALIANEVAMRLYDAIAKEEESINTLADLFSRIKTLRKELNESWRSYEDLKGDLEWSRLKYNRTKREYNARASEVTGHDLVGEQQKLAQLSELHDNIIDWAREGAAIDNKLNKFRVSAAQDLKDREKYSHIHARFVENRVLLPDLNGFANLVSSENPASITEQFNFLLSIQH